MQIECRRSTPRELERGSSVGSPLPRGLNVLDFRIVDADNHYYEATDAFTRHLEPAMAKRTIQWAEVVRTGSSSLSDFSRDRR